MGGKEKKQEVLNGAGKTVQKILYLEELFDGDLRSYPSTQGNKLSYLVLPQ